MLKNVNKEEADNMLKLNKEAAIKDLIIIKTSQINLHKKQKTTIYILLFFKCFDTIILYSKIEEISYEKQINYFCSINFKFIYDSKQSS